MPHPSDRPMTTTDWGAPLAIQEEMIVLVDNVAFCDAGPEYVGRKGRVLEVMPFTDEEHIKVEFDGKGRPIEFFWPHNLVGIVS